jgi:basic membrane protein A
VRGTHRLPALTAALAALALVAAAAAAASTSRAAADFNVGFVTTLAGIRDGAVNQQANAGLQRAMSELGVGGVVTSTGTTNDYIPGLTAFGQQNYNLVIAPRMVGELAQVSVTFPKVMYAGIDTSIDEFLDTPANYVGVMFRNEEAGYLAGYLAGLVIDASKLSKRVTGIGGVEDNDEAQRYLAGFVAGIHKADRKIKVDVKWADTVTERLVCKKIADDELKAGASVVFSVAGRCGDAALKAAAKKKRWGIGFDFDQSSLGPFVLTSAIKHVDQAVYLTIRDARAGTLKGGADVYYGAAQGAVGLAKISPQVPKAIVKQVTALEAQLKAGKVKKIPTSVS